MKRIILLLILTAIKAMVFAQGYGLMEINKTINTHYKVIPVSLGGGYAYKNITAEIAFKTNWEEYYTLVYHSVGYRSLGHLYVGVNVGGGWTLSIPQLDRRYDPITKQYTIITEGYTSKSIFCLYGNVRLGGNIKFKDLGTQLTPYASYTYCFKEWKGIGIIITSIK